ncbi:MAG TPA: peptidyl-alpha-hydroxyglycine alpha-amidating lyase family protein [Candidatus Acidoferrum sp.]|nr:peptidyl-alpha-hydroxyglycine alpha-amidating lyase family protein [Candidatus Acidoferrum sp.]
MRFFVALVLVLGSAVALAQRPDRPSLPLNAYTLTGYHAVDQATALHLPAGVTFGSIGSVTITPDNHLLVLNRGEVPFYEFATDGTFIRSFGDKSLFRVAHGLRFGPSGELWVTDIGNHVVYKMDTNGKVLMTLGTPGKAGDWDEASGQHMFNQPNETAIDSHGNLYVVQGHTFGEPKVLKFDRNGKFIKQWGKKGTGPGEFYAAHSIEIDANDVLYVADRENMRIQRFDTDGKFLGEWKFSAMVCGLYLHKDGFMYLTSGFDGEWAKLDMKDGKLIGSLGSPGKDNGQFGEAHMLAVDAQGNVYIGDVGNRRVQVYRRD